MNEATKNKLIKLKTEFLFYAPFVLKIRAKEAIEIDWKMQKIIPFIPNIAQLYIHKRLEAQKKEKGYVREQTN